MSDEDFQSVVEELSIVMDLPKETIVYTIKRIQHAYRDEQESLFEQVKREAVRKEQQ